jgi:hypothetical protein
VKHIYADFNDIATDRTLPLTCRGSRDSIAEQREPLHDGEQVFLSDGELQVIARIFVERRLRSVDRPWFRSEFTS